MHAPDTTTYTTYNGVIVPMGKIVPVSAVKHSLMYDEFICYEEKDISIRYIVLFKFSSY